MSLSVSCICATHAGSSSTTRTFTCILSPSGLRRLAGALEPSDGGNSLPAADLGSADGDERQFHRRAQPREFRMSEETRIRSFRTLVAQVAAPRDELLVTTPHKKSPRRSAG